MGEARRRARELGIVPGRFPAGPANAITDVPGLRVGQVTIAHDEFRTGVTAIVPDALPTRKALPA
ncbi:MAG: P1 family peptidase, partial [Thermomicrobiales bacterium]